MLHAFLPEELRRGASRRDAERVDADDLLRLRVVDEGLRLAAAERIPHRGHRAKHAARGVDGVAALLKNHRAGGGAERLASDRHPVPAVEGRFDRSLSGRGRSESRAARQSSEAALGAFRPPILSEGLRPSAPSAKASAVSAVALAKAELPARALARRWRRRARSRGSLAPLVRAINEMAATAYSSISISRTSSAAGRRRGTVENRAQAFHRSRASSLPDGRSHSARSK